MGKLYQVKVHIIEVRGLIAKDASGVPSPLVVVTVRGEEQATAAQKNTSSAFYDHVFFFDLDLSDEDYTETQISIQVKNLSDSIFEGDTMIGRADVDISSVYKMQNHEVYKKWVGLTNPENPEITGVTGYLRFSITVLTEGDEPVTHNDGDDEVGDATDLSASILKQQDIKYEQYKLIVRVFRCTNLPKIDFVTGCDPRVGVIFGGRIDTKVVKGSINPVFNQELIVPAVEPSLTDNIRVIIEDWNVTNSTPIADLVFRFSKIKIEELPPRWFHLYGDPMEEDKVSSALNTLDEFVDTVYSRAKEEVMLTGKKKRGHVEDSAYLGSILLGMSVEKVDFPAKFGSRGATTPQLVPEETWTLWFDAYEATELAAGGALEEFFSVIQTELEVSVGAHKIVSERDSIKDGNVKWYKSLEEARIRLCSDVSQVPDIFVNIFAFNTLTRRRTRIGFVRLPASSIRNHECDARWRELTPDPRLRGVSSAGFVLFGIGFGPSRLVKEKRKRLKKPGTKKYQLRCHIYQAKNLTAADANGNSDGYVIARCSGTSARTSVKNDMSAPRWYESLLLDVDLPQPLTLAPNLNLIVMDQDEVFDEMIGRCSFRVSDISAHTPEEPRWYNIHAEDPDTPEGQILVSFQLIPVEDLLRTKLESIAPKEKPCIVEIQCIGVRGLLPYLGLPIDEPQLIFSVGERSEANKAIKKTRFSRKPNGANANFLENINVFVNLPENPLFCPSLDVAVVDNRVTGEAMVGTTDLWLGKYLPWATADDIDKHEYVEPPPDLDEVFEEVAVEDMDNITSFNEEMISGDWLDGIEDFVVPDRKKKGKDVGGRGPRFLPELPDTDLGTQTDPEEEEEGKEKVVVVRTVDDELEDELTDLPFSTFTFYRGQNATRHPVGTFKGAVRVFELAKRASYKPISVKDVFRMRTYKIRVYVIRGIGLQPPTRAKAVNPYLVVFCGDGKTGKRDDSSIDAQEDTIEPDFYRGFQLTGMIPGDSELTIQVFSKAGITGIDALIGQTSIDLENRLFSDQWKAMNPKLRENRNIYKPGSKLAKGKIEMWLEILKPEDASVTPMVDMKAPEVSEWELRVVIWHTFDVPFVDSIDLKVTGQPDGHPEQETDTHMFVKDGQGNFNFRFVWRLLLPDKKRAPRLKFAIWDKNIIASDEAIGEAGISLKAFYDKALKKRSKESIPRQTILCRHPAKGDQGCGRIDLEIDILPASDADEMPVGKGRGAPNRDPTLPPPVRPGAFDLLAGSLSWDLLGLGGLKRKCMLCCVVVVIVVVILAALKV